jgi:hypothetical protein
MESLIIIIPLGGIALLITTTIVICLKLILDELFLGLTYGYDENTRSIVSFKEKKIYNKFGYLKFKETDFVGLGLMDSKCCTKNILPELDVSQHYQLTDKYVIAFKKNGYVYVEFSINSPLANPLTIITKKKSCRLWPVWLVRKFI